MSIIRPDIKYEFTRILSVLFLISVLIISGCRESNLGDQHNYMNWAHYLGDEATTQFSSLSEINTENIMELELAWTYDSGSANAQGKTQIQCNPLIIDGILYGSNPSLSIFAIDAATGEELWTFNPWEHKPYDQYGMGVNRGLTMWQSDHRKRLFFTADSYLHCINPETGKPFTNFGENGKINLLENLGRDVEDRFLVSNSPGVIYQDKIIIGGRVSESMGHVPGHIRAYDVKTGRMEWIFHTIPQPGEYGYDTWPPDAYKNSGGANCWAGMSIDPEEGIVYVPTGSPSFDFYGGDRKGENLFANCLLALDAETGKLIWHFQMTHHDLWDRDLPAPPVLCEVEINGKVRKAVAQVTKSAHIFLFDRLTGKPLYRIDEVKVPPSDLKGEEAWPTQPIPTNQKPFSRSVITEEDLTDRTPEANKYAKEIWHSAKKNIPYTPLSLQGNLVFPGLDGGAEWGGPAVDRNGTMYVNTNEMAWHLQMLPYSNNQATTKQEYGRELYTAFCQSCHGKDFEGASIYTIPSLKGINNRIDKSTLLKNISNGKGNMPAMGHLSTSQQEAIASFLLELPDGDDPVLLQEDGSTWAYPYFFNGYKKFVDQEGYPAIKPPWGTLNAIDLSTAQIKWKIPLGEYPELAILGTKNTGSENYGGPLVTESGLVIIAATLDEKIRIFNSETAELLWQYKLPAAGFATPATYSIDNRQYIVIAAGGGKLGRKSGSQYLAFALPQKNK